MKLAYVITIALSGLLTAAEPFIEKQDLFTVGEDPAYSLYHIPGVVVTAKGTVLAWCEARKRAAGVSDWDDIRILLRRSTDDGKTWSAPKSIANVEGPKQKNPFALKMKNVDPNDVTYNNPVLIADKDGTVHMLFCLEYERVFYQRSEDDGLTFSKPTEITTAFEAFKKDYDWKVLATGPNHSIQLKTGRLVSPSGFPPAPAAMRIAPASPRPSTAMIQARLEGRRHRRALHRGMDQPERDRRHRTQRRQCHAQRPQRIEGAPPPHHHQQRRRHWLEHAEVRRRPARTHLHGRHRSLQLRRPKPDPLLQSAQPR
jgi:hypothetical protein